MGFLNCECCGHSVTGESVLKPNGKMYIYYRCANNQCAQYKQRTPQGGRICTKTLKVSLSRSFAGQQVGIKEMEDGLWVVSFMDYDLGYFDERGSRVEPVEDPFGFEKV